MARKAGDGRGRMGGRTKGTPNKNSVNTKIMAEKLKIDPFKILLYFASGDWKKLGYKDEYEEKVTVTGMRIDCRIISPELRERAAETACQYLHPKRKPIDSKGDDSDVPIAIYFKEK